VQEAERSTKSHELTLNTLYEPESSDLNATTNTEHPERWRVDSTGNWREIREECGDANYKSSGDDADYTDQRYNDRRGLELKQHEATLELTVLLNVNL
jgi:hypothetical protein